MKTRSAHAFSRRRGRWFVAVAGVGAIVMVVSAGPVAAVDPGEGTPWITGTYTPTTVADGACPVGSVCV